jgi:hypothetical protein
MIGRIVALGSWSAAGVSGNCVMGGSSDIDYPLIAYNISTSTGGDVPACEFLRAFSR